MMFLSPCTAPVVTQRSRGGTGRGLGSAMLRGVDVRELRAWTLHFSPTRTASKAMEHGCEGRSSSGHRSLHCTIETSPLLAMLGVVRNLRGTPHFHESLYAPS